MYGSTMDDSPKVKNLDSLKIGDSEVSRLVFQVLQAIDPEDASVGIDRLAGRCLVSGWTVYRWLRGTHSPRSRQLVVIDKEAKRLGVQNVKEAAPTEVDAAPVKDAIAL